MAGAGCVYVETLVCHGEASAIGGEGLHFYTCRLAVKGIDGADRGRGAEGDHLGACCAEGRGLDLRSCHEGALVLSEEGWGHYEEKCRVGVFRLAGWGDDEAGLVNLSCDFVVGKAL